MMKPWEKPFEELRRILKAQDDYRDVLEYIDTEIMRRLDSKTEGTNAILSLIEECISKIIPILHAENGDFYIRNGEKEFVRYTHLNDEHYERPSVLSFKSILNESNAQLTSKSVLEQPVFSIDLINSEKGPDLVGCIFRGFGDSTDIFGVLVFFGISRPANLTSTLDDEPNQKLLGICKQLSNGTRLFTAENRERAFHELVRQGFRLELEPLNTLSAVLKALPKLWPQMGPISFEEPENIQVQLLLWVPRRRFFLSQDGNELDSSASLIIVSDSDRNNKTLSVGAQVLVDNSVSGYVVEDPNLPYYLCDPRKEALKGRYRQYLGNEMKHELVIPFELPGLSSKTSQHNVRGILNFETPEADAFKAFHIEYMLKLLADDGFLQNFLESLLILWRKDIDTLRAAFQAQADYAKQQSLWAGHGMRNQVQDIDLALEKIKKSVKKNEPAKTNKLIDSASERILGLKKIVEEYAGIFVSASTTSDHYLKARIYKALDLINAKKVECHDDTSIFQIESANTVVTVFDGSGDDGLVVETSTIISQHFFNLLQNSAQAIERKRNETEAGERGEISINIGPREFDSENRANQMCKLTFLDNGAGIDASIIGELNRGMRPVTNRKNGSGYGLFSLRQYVKALGGETIFSSENENGFCVEIYLPLKPIFPERS